MEKEVLYYGNDYLIYLFGSEPAEMGKNIVGVNSTKTMNILQGALKMGVTEKEFKMLFDHFNYNKHTCNRLEYIDGGEQNKVDYIFRESYAYKRPNIRDYYLKMMRETIVDDLTECGFPIECSLFELAFDKKMESEGLQNVERWGHIEINTDFRKLFVSDEAMYRALDAAKKFGLIRENGEWAMRIRGDKKKIISYWIAVSGSKYGLTKIEASTNEKVHTIDEPCKVIALQFGLKTFGKDVGYNYDRKKTDSLKDKIMAFLSS